MYKNSYRKYKISKVLESKVEDEAFERLVDTTKLFFVNMKDDNSEFIWYVSNNTESVMRYDPTMNRCHYFDYGYMQTLRGALYDIDKTLNYSEFIKCSIEYYFNITIDEFLINRQ